MLDYDQTGTVLLNTCRLINDSITIVYVIEYLHLFLKYETLK